MQAPNTEALVQRVDAVLLKQGDLRFRAESQALLERGSAGAFRAAGLSLLLDIYGTNHHHYRDFERLTDGEHGHRVDQYAHAVSILKVVREEILAGWLEGTRGLIAAEVFSDFLEMAQHLWDEGYKDAAAVIAGSSLEAHLKRLCETHGIDLEVTNAKGELVAKKADTLNADLVKTNVYDKTEQKQVTAWLGVRNDAAHGHYAKVINEVVGAMIHGIRMFIGRYPA
jgi:hypothetical protein